MNIDNLLRQMTIYNNNDINITGSPDITFFKKSYNYTKFRKYTNFSHGIIYPDTIIRTKDTVQIENLNSLGDMIRSIIIIIDDIDNLSNIIINIEDIDPIFISVEYLKMYNLIYDKTIIKIDVGYLISFNLENFIVLYNDGNNDFNGLPLSILTINYICVKCKNPEKTNLKFDSVILDTEERRRIKVLHENNPKKNIYLESYKIIENDNILWNINFCKTFYHGHIGCIITKSNYDLMESIDISFNGFMITITKNSLELFNNFYDKIIYKYGEDIFIKIKYLSRFNKKKNWTNYTLKINFKNNNFLLVPEYNLEKVYQFQNVYDSSIDNCLIVYTTIKDDGNIQEHMTNGYYEYNTKLNSTDKKFKIEIDPKNVLTHIKEIFIFFTNLQTGKKEKIANKFSISISDITNEYSSLDMEIFSKLAHSKSNSIDDVILNQSNLIYTIGYYLNSNYSYPTGLYNLTNKSVKIEFDLNFDNVCTNIDSNFISDYQVNVIFFGFNIC